VQVAVVHGVPELGGEVAEVVRIAHDADDARGDVDRGGGGQIDPHEGGGEARGIPDRLHPALNLSSSALAQLDGMVWQWAAGVR